MLAELRNDIVRQGSLRAVERPARFGRIRDQKGDRSHTCWPHVLEHDLSTGVRLPGGDMIEQVIVKEMPRNSHTSQWNSCLIPHAQLRLYLIVSLVTEFWSFARHLDAGYLCTVGC